MEEGRKIQLIRTGFNFVAGSVIGTFDSMATGLPILTAGIPLWETMRFLDYQQNCERYGMSRKVETSEGLVYYSKGLVPYIVGASIPFAVKYHNEISTLIKNLME